MSDDLPLNLPRCDPRQRLFPLEWKESFFRRRFDERQRGYICPGCKGVFVGTAGLSELEADHIIPFSKGGLTVWSNMILRCKPCNNTKSDNIDGGTTIAD